MSDPLVSVVLLTRNGGAALRELVEAVARQRTDFVIEILAVDSGSTDGTAEWLEVSPLVAKVVRIAPAQFNHGTTRNLGVAEARGEYAVLIVQDALPVSDGWLTHLVAPLRRDASVAGAFCRQCPSPDASAITRHYFEQWAGASAEGRRVATDAAALGALAPAARLALCTFDNVCSCIRRSVWQKVPFPETVIAEDVEWGRDVLLAGFALEFVADALVVHSHDRPAGYELARTYLLHHRLFHLVGLRTIPRIRDLARAVASSTRVHVGCEQRARREGKGESGWWRALALAVAWPLGQYLGGLSASRGWKPIRWRAV